MLADSGWSVCALIVVSIGLRASATIAAERERGTWDSILTSPLEGGEIVRGKLWGSLHALRWLIVAAFGSWAVACLVEGMSLWNFASLASQTLIIGIFAAALGMRSSLKYPSATRAMLTTIVVLLIVHACAALASALIVGVAALFVLMTLSRLQSIPFFGTLLKNLPPFYVVWTILLLLLYIGMNITLIGSTALRFDRLAGRMTGGAFAGAVDRFFHGGRIEDPVAVAEENGGRIEGPVAVAEKT